MKSALRKLTSIAVAVLMVALLVPAAAFAANETGTITVDNPQKDRAYTAYKIFDVAYDKNTDGTAGSHYSYTIDSSSDWYETVRVYATDANGMTLEQVAGTTTYNVKTTGTFSAASFSNALKAAVGGKTGTPLVDGSKDGKAVKTATVPSLGYYFVNSDTGALCNLTTTNPDAIIHDKNDVPFDKVDDKESVEVGEIVNYIITGKVPDTTGFETYKYEITDVMSSGLSFNNDIKVFVGGVETTENFTKKIGAEADGKTFVITFDAKQMTAGAEIKITYSATVNDNAVTKTEHNHATLEYSNDPTDESKTTTREDEEKVYSAKIAIDKYAEKEDKNDTTQKLSGAKFVLYKMVTPEGSSESIKQYYKYTAATSADKAKVEWVTDQQYAVTTENGIAGFEGLKDGTYYLEEIEAPAGYNKLTGPVTIVINGSDTTQANPLLHTEQVANSTGTTLPSTGGIGTTIFYVGGGILIVGALAAFIIKRRSAKHTA